MKLTLMFRSVRYVLLVVVLAVWETSAPADVITTGDVDPGGTATQPNPWAVGGTLKVGNSGAGRLNVTDGGVVSNTWAYIGTNPSSTGEATITGSGSQWNHSDQLYVGRQGSGTLNVEAGGVVNSAGERSYIGYDVGSTGEMTVTGVGSQWGGSRGLHVGRSGIGTLNVTDGGVVNSDYAYIGGADVVTDDTGESSDSIGEATVTGAGSKWNNLEYRVFVGLSGTGTLNVTDGGVVNSYGGLMGHYVGSTGEATVTGAGSKWNSSGYLNVGRQGSGTLNVEAGGVVNSAGGRSYIGSHVGSTGEATITGSGSQWNNSGELYVGREGSGTLNVEAGGVVNSAGERSYIGYDVGSTGEMTVTGVGSQWGGSRGLHVGRSGIGTLNVTDGGVVNSDYAYIGGANVVTDNTEESSDSIGEATVTGAGSKWNNLEYLYLGLSGTGTLNVTDGGVVNSYGGLMGHYVGSTGEATVTGAGSQWNSSGGLSVGRQGSGTLNVEAGGVVNNGGAAIGDYSDSTGVASITGTGSRWNNSGQLYVGREGSGTLNVEAGGVVANTDGFLGYNSSSTGEATITGSGSQWNNSRYLTVGRDGTGTLNIEDESLVTVGSTTSIGATGSVNLTGGRFEFGQTTLEEFSTINATSGAMAGDVMITGVHDVASLTTLQNSLVELNEVAAANEGLLYGSAILKSSLDNRAAGELRTTASQWVRFEGDSNINAGEINNFGGQVNFAQDLTNAADGEINNFDGALVVGGTVTNVSNGFIGGRGQFVGDGGWTNSGVMFFTGTTDILGDVVNDAGGQIVTSGSMTTTFYDDLEHNGAEIRTSLGSTTVIGGSATGAGPYTGDGTVYFEGDLRPGNSPGTVSFGGDVVLGPGSTTQIELGGVSAGAEHDHLNIAGAANLDGTLDMLPLAPYTDPATRGTSDDFVIITAAERSGTFSTVQYDGSTLVIDFGPDSNGSFRSHQGDGLFRNITYTSTTVQLQNLLAHEGDSDGDQDVDITDFNALAANFDPDGATAPHSWAAGNFNGDHSIDITDFNFLASNFAPDGYGASVIPEPSALLLALLGLTLLAGARVR